MKTYMFHISPYAQQTGHIEIPDDVESTAEYIREHFGEAKMDEAELDYCGCDIDDIEEEEE